MPTLLAASALSWLETIIAILLEHAPHFNAPVIVVHNTAVNIDINQLAAPLVHNLLI
jgi:hypothetical protein